jgi:hypothetical protein
MPAFWQKKQDMLHPKLPADRILLPGKNRASGFFSTGSRARLVNLP